MKNFEVKVSNRKLKKFFFTDMSLTEMIAFYLLVASEIYSTLLAKDPIAAAGFKYKLQAGTRNDSPVWNGKSMPGVAMVVVKEKNREEKNDD